MDSTSDKRLTSSVSSTDTCRSRRLRRKNGRRSSHGRSSLPARRHQVSFLSYKLIARSHKGYYIAKLVIRLIVNVGKVVVSQLVSG